MTSFGSIQQFGTTRHQFSTRSASLCKNHDIIPAFSTTARDLDGLRYSSKPTRNSRAPGTVQTAALLSTQCADMFHNALRMLFRVCSLPGIMAACISAVAVPASRSDTLLDASARHDRLRTTLADTYAKVIRNHQKSFILVLQPMAGLVQC